MPARRWQRSGRLCVCKEVNEVEYQINLGFFEGPLDLLFHLVKKNKMEINQISLSSVTEQYLAYIRKMRELDLDFAGDFLVTAAQLMELKSRSLLPKRNAGEEEAEAAPNDLVARLLEYKRFKELANVLKEKEEDREHCFSRDNERLVEEVISELPELNPLENVTLEDFKKAFLKALQDAHPRELPDDDEERPEFKVEEITVKDKILEIEAILGEMPAGIAFSRLFSRSLYRVEVVVTFLAILELIKLKMIKVTQNQLYGEIFICREG